jgi:uncharacterized protein YeaC (DUF1315 family)
MVLHPEHAMYQNVSDRVSVCYAARGVALGHEQFENAVAGVMADARAERMTDVDELRFVYNPESGRSDLSTNRGGRLKPWPTVWDINAIKRKTKWVLNYEHTSSQLA